MEKNPKTDKIWLSTIPDTPLGPITSAVSTQGLTGVYFDDENIVREMLQQAHFPADAKTETLLSAASDQIDAYLRGSLKRFDLPIDWSVCTVFQQQVLIETCKIAYGQVKTYGDIANALGNPKTIRAVGGAVARNPMPLVIPCHRVVSPQGKLRGYSGRGGVQTKAWLLQLEGHFLVS